MLKLAAGEYLGKPLRRRCLSGLSLTVSTYSPRCAYPWHVHELPTLFVLLAGQHHDENRRESFDQSPLSVVFHPTIGPHATSIGLDGMVGINLDLTDAWLDRCRLRQRDLEVEYRLLDSKWARLLGLRLAASVSEVEETAEADVETAALELVAGLVRDPLPPTRTPPWLARAKEFLEAYAHTPVRLRDVAAEVGVHPVYCARAFRRGTGCTVSAYVHILRLLDAGRLILDEGRPLAEAALRAGFADQAHFTRTCSRTLGFTPGRLRRVRQALFAEPAGSTRSRNHGRKSLTSEV
jgi:AraC family transcriptional regulator